MTNTMTELGQTVVPAEIRQRFQPGPADRLDWGVDDGAIRAVPVQLTPVDAFRRLGLGGATRRLLVDRRRDEAKG